MTAELPPTLLINGHADDEVPASKLCLPEIYIPCGTGTDKARS
jgi:hypothetical protein